MKQIWREIIIENKLNLKNSYVLCKFRLLTSVFLVQ